jgi:hypothetical protein
MNVLVRPVSPFLSCTVIVGSWYGSRNVKLSTVTSVNLRILEMSPSLKVALMLLFSRMTSVIWTKAAFEAAEMKVGRGVGMVRQDGQDGQDGQDERTGWDRMG